MFRELGCTGHFDTSWFQGLSGGKTWSFATMRSACGVSNNTGLRMAGRRRDLA